MVTNIPGPLVEGKIWSVEIAEQTILGRQTYSDTPIGSLIALVDSNGWVEVAVNGGNAQMRLGVDLGANVQVLIVLEN